tara:strand:- start:176700 stop:178673 length:1974 start_codon:yes stop_codon:yes gene_type:complete
LKKIFGLHIIFVVITFPLFAQVADSAAVDTSRTQMIEEPAESSLRESSISTQKEEEPDPGKITPWTEQIEIGSTQITNDSLLRWQIWPNWGDFYAYRKDAISFRQGTIGRVDAYHISGYEPQEQHVKLEGLTLNHPLTGIPNYNLVPHRKLGRVSESYAGNLSTELKIRDFYITKPVSYLIYDEAKGDYRNLEFLVSQNFSEATNVEISFWDRKGGAYYPNNSVAGSQAFARVYHHLNDRLMVRTMYLRNQLERDEPFGYAVGDPLAFTFDEFSSIPNNSTANSEYTRWDLITGIYQRKDSSLAENGGVELSISKNKQNLFFAPDTLNQHLRSLNVRGFKRLEFGKFELKGDVQLSQHAALENTPISKNNWLEFSGETKAGYHFTPDILLYANGNIQTRNDSRSAYETVVGLKALLYNRLKLQTSAALYSQIPTMQSLYWNAGNYSGNEELENEAGLSLSGNLDFELTPTITIGASGRMKSGENSSFITPDSSFINSGSFLRGNASGYLRFQNHRFEIETSGVIQQTQFENETPEVAALNHQDQIIWLRNSGFVKGYVFDRAAYLKMGVRTLFSPFYYSARMFNTELGYWQGSSSYQEIPPFFRLDAELSARVRGIMVVMRWENALDGLGQAGYFEAAGFPMPPRRLIIGIRAQFRN